MSGAITQKQGVYNAIVAFCGDHDIHFEDGMEFKPTKDQRSTIVEMVATAIEAGEVELSAVAREKYAEFSKLKSYCNGLVSNWLRKDTRLNGDVKYEIKNPGSRAGSGDEVIKELRKLLKTLSDTDQRATVQGEIDSRLTALKMKKNESIQINADLIPEELRSLVNTNN